MLTEDKIRQIAQKSFNAGKAACVFELRDAVVRVLTRQRLIQDVHRSLLTAGKVNDWVLISRVTQEVWDAST